MWDVLVGIATFGLWVLLPLVPSILLFKIFPNTSITTSGPLAGLTVRASGAFGGYLVIFASIGYPLLTTGTEIRTSLHRNFWNVSGYIKPSYGKGKIANKVQLTGVIVETTPIPLRVENDFISGSVVEDVANRLPRIIISADKYRPKPVDLNIDGPEVKRDGSHKNIEISPVVEEDQPYPPAEVAEKLDNVPSKLDNVSGKLGNLPAKKNYPPKK